MLLVLVEVCGSTSFWRRPDFLHFMAQCLVFVWLYSHKCVVVLREVCCLYLQKYVVVLEEEVILAPDFLNFMAQSLDAVEKDESLIGVSAWNDNGESCFSRYPF